MPDCHWLLKTPFKWLSLTGHALSLSWLLIADPARLAQDWSASRDGFRSSSRRLLAALPRMGSAWCCFWRERGRWEIRSIFSSSRPWEWGGPWWTDRCYEKTQFEKEANVQVRGQTLAEVETTSKCTGNDRTWGFVAFNAFQTYQASQEAQWHCETSQKKNSREAWQHRQVQRMQQMQMEIGMQIMQLARMWQTWSCNWRGWYWQEPAWWWWCRWKRYFVSVWNFNLESSLSSLDDSSQSLSRWQIFEAAVIRAMRWSKTEPSPFYFMSVSIRQCQCQPA